MMECIEYPCEGKIDHGDPVEIVNGVARKISTIHIERDLHTVAKIRKINPAFWAFLSAAPESTIGVLAKPGSGEE